MPQDLRDTPIAEKSASLAFNMGGGGVIAPTSGRAIQLQYGRWAQPVISFLRN